MREDLFQPKAPGRLVPCSITDHALNGQPKHVAGKAFVPNPLPPDLSSHDLGEILDAALDAQTALIRLHGQVAALPDPNLLIKPLARREIKFSSKIEDAVATIREVALVEANMPAPRPEVWDVRDNLLALEHGLNSPLPISLKLLREMHATLFERTDNLAITRIRPGEFRDRPVYIGNKEQRFAHARFVPPPPGQTLMSCLDAYEKFLHPAQYPRRQYHMLIELALSHYQFECIHPFNDGNGRLGRLIITLTPVKAGLLNHALPYVSPYFETHREQYYDALLRVSTRGDWIAWIRFFCRAVESECNEGHNRAQRLFALRNQYRSQLGTKKTSALALRLLDALFVQPAVTIASAAQLLGGITPPTATNHVRRLEALGFLVEVTGGNYGRVWIAEQIVRILDE